MLKQLRGLLKTQSVFKNKKKLDEKEKIHPQIKILIVKKSAENNTHSYRRQLPDQTEWSYKKQNKTKQTNKQKKAKPNQTNKQKKPSNSPQPPPLQKQSLFQDAKIIPMCFFFKIKKKPQAQGWYILWLTWQSSRESEVVPTFAIKR